MTASPPVSSCCAAPEMKLKSSPSVRCRRRVARVWPSVLLQKLYGDFAPAALQVSSSKLRNRTCRLCLSTASLDLDRRDCERATTSGRTERVKMHSSCARTLPHEPLSRRGGAGGICALDLAVDAIAEALRDD